MCRRDAGMDKWKINSSRVTALRSSQFSAIEPRHKDEDLYPVLPARIIQRRPTKKEPTTSFTFDVNSSEPGKLFNGCDDYGPFFKFNNQRKKNKISQASHRRQKFVFS